MQVEDITDSQWLQCCLRINQGGLGVSEHTAHAAYTASFLSTFTDIEQILPNHLQLNQPHTPTINNYVTSIRIINY